MNDTNLIARIRRTFLTAGLAGLLLVGGGAAAVLAQSPDATSSPAPAATDGDTTQVDRADRADCPEKAGNVEAAPEASSAD